MTPKPAPVAIITGDYQTPSGCMFGTPENVTCVRSLRLREGGTGTYIGDDIAEPIKWTRQGDHVRVLVGTWSMDLRVNGDQLVDAHGTRWSHKPDR